MTAIFVFGSNLAGRHGKGAALFARENRGAIYGLGVGLQGQSYAIPTKDERLRTLPLPAINLHVGVFKQFAASRPDLTFDVTPIGCGLAGYSPSQIGPMFEGATPNVILPDVFVPYARGPRRVLVCGGRTYADKAKVYETLDSLNRLQISVLIQGGAQGADALSKAWALDNGVPMIEEVAKWNDIHREGALVKIGRDQKPYDALAGIMRNQRMLMLHKPTVVVAFPGGRGTGDMIRRSKAAGLEPMLIPE